MVFKATVITNILQAKHASKSFNFFPNLINDTFLQEADKDDKIITFFHQLTGNKYIN